jgi:hypothetical protein
MAREVEVADSRHVPILPVRVEEIEPAGDMEYFLGNRQWFDLLHGKIERRRALPDAIASLLRDQPAAPAAAPLPPAKPAPRRAALPKWTVPFAVAAVLGIGTLVNRYLTPTPSVPPARSVQAPVTPQPVAPAPTAVPAPVQPAKPAPKQQAKIVPAPAAPPPTAPVANFAGKWQAEVKYTWGAVHNETFQFKVDDKELYGTASYVRTPRGILDGKVEGNRITFTTKSQTMLGDKTYEEKHFYRGRLTPDGIDFTLQTDSGYDSRSPEMFTAKKIE